MWLYLITIVLFVAGVGAALGGIGPVAIILVLLALVGLAVKVLGGRGGDPDVRSEPTGNTMSSTGGGSANGTPQDDVTLGKAHAKTGYAHTGQAHMTPEQERR
jgi:hypothetical protein